MRILGLDRYTPIVMPLTMGDDDEEGRTPPRRTPGQAEGQDERSPGEGSNDETLRRRRPGQAEGPDAEDEADEVPPED